jgi:DGQHR domain-containing protein
MKDPTENISIRALRTLQSGDVNIYAFFIYGDQISRVADISRVRRDDDELVGFQRREIKTHVSAIAEFLGGGNVLFPNAIILALSPEVKFEKSRGPKQEDELVEAGRLTIPVRPEGKRAAWIVDGQQRALALAKAKRSDLLVPVIAFESSEIAVQREQFILVNKAKPLPSRLIDELLPEVGVDLPRDLSMRKTPSALCHALSIDPGSPFRGLIRRESNAGATGPVVADTALIQAIKDNFRLGGSLSVYSTEAGLDQHYQTLCIYWTQVRNVFSTAWGKPPSESRLMHSAGIRVMGALMDPIWTRADSSAEKAESVRQSLERLAPYCRWTEGEWEELGWAWDEVQATQKHIKGLKAYMFRKDRELSRPVT